MTYADDCTLLSELQEQITRARYELCTENGRLSVWNGKATRVK